VDLVHTVILSLVEGVTEFLPISSTGHLILASQILGIHQTEFVKSFEIIIQLGAILAVVVLYWRKLFNVKIWPQLLMAFIPAAVIGFVGFKIIEGVLLGNSLITVIALFIGGIMFILIEYWNKKRDLKNDTDGIENITLLNAFIIGLFQSISVIPGTSRAGATILGGLIMRVNRKTAAEFSFLLAVPTMIAATGLDIVKTKFAFTSNEIAMLALGFLLSFVFALIAIKLLLQYISKHDFTVFGIYRIVLAIIFYIIFLR
jgi:undecaprenyl-diphosphatase